MFEVDLDFDPYYPNEPIGGDNPYYRCISCGRSGPQINGKISGHASSCSWANAKRSEIKAPLCPMCNKNKLEEKHPCPFAQEIYGSDELCSCCNSCAMECCQDI